MRKSMENYLLEEIRAIRKSKIHGEKLVKSKEVWVVQILTTTVLNGNG